MQRGARERDRIDARVLPEAAVLRGHGRPHDGGRDVLERDGDARA